jgi:predicted MPP superfamily phosphohydrolase
MAKPSHVPNGLIIIVMGVLALLHYYIGARLLPALPAGPWAALGVAWLLASFVLMPASMAAPYMVRQPLADRLAWGGYLAMGLFSTLLILTMLRDLSLLGLGLLGSSWRGPWLAASAVGVPLASLLASAVGFVNAQRRPGVVEVDVLLPRLPPEFEGYTIVQISDLHVGPTIKRRFVQRVVELANSLQPDVMAVTGDLVDGRVEDLAEHIALLAQLHARDGVFGVTGNHDYYSGAQHWVPEYRRLGIRMLTNEHVVIERGAARLLLAGVTDFEAHNFFPDERSDPKQALLGAPPDVAVRVLLAHQPRSAEAAHSAGFDLQLSGHTHGGQFWPWSLVVPLQQPYTAGLVRHGSLWVYISRGTGYWGPPKRLGAPSEVTRLRLTSG